MTQPQTAIWHRVTFRTPTKTSTVNSEGWGGGSSYSTTNLVIQISATNEELKIKEEKKTMTITTTCFIE